jgi:hypothetical protein
MALARVSLLIVLVATGAATAGCGPAIPVYRTTYNYVPPTEDTGRTCAVGCENMRTQCSMMLQQQTMMCRNGCNMQPRGQDDCLRRCETGSSDQMCIDQYNRCYQTCGGEVETLRECTAHCETVVAVE